MKQRNTLIMMKKDNVKQQNLQKQKVRISVKMENPGGGFVRPAARDAWQPWFYISVMLQTLDMQLLILSMRFVRLCGYIYNQC